MRRRGVVAHNWYWPHNTMGPDGYINPAVRGVPNMAVDRLIGGPHWGVVDT